MSFVSEEQIIEGTLNLFLKFGISSVSMEDISSSIGISKKTLYQLFNNKEYLGTAQKLIGILCVDYDNIE